MRRLPGAVGAVVLVCAAVLVGAALHGTSSFTIGPVELMSYDGSDPTEGRPYDAWIRCDGDEGRYVTETGELLFFSLAGPIEQPIPDPAPFCASEASDRRAAGMAVAFAAVVGGMIALVIGYRTAQQQLAEEPGEPMPRVG